MRGVPLGDPGTRDGPQQGAAWPGDARLLDAAGSSPVNPTTASATHATAGADQCQRPRSDAATSSAEHHPAAEVEDAAAADRVLDEVPRHGGDHHRPGDLDHRPPSAPVAGDGVDEDDHRPLPEVDAVRANPIQRSGAHARTAPSRPAGLTVAAITATVATERSTKPHGYRNGENGVGPPDEHENSRQSDETQGVESLDFRNLRSRRPRWLGQTAAKLHR